MKALVLSGGGAKGCWEAGVIKALVENGKEWDIFTGTSVGALNAAMMAQHENPYTAVQKLCDIWNNIETNKVYKHHNFLKWLSVPWKQSVYDTTPLRELVKKNISYEMHRNAGKTFIAVSVDMISGKTIKHDFSVDGIMASAAFPLMFTPEKVYGKFLLDGGIREVTPLQAAIGAGAKEIDVVMCSTSHVSRWTPPTGFGSLVGIATRTLELMMSEIIENDIKRCQDANKAVLSNTPLKPWHSYIKVNIISPKNPLGIDSLKFDNEKMRNGLLQGYNENKL